MNAQPKISVIVPVYKCEQYIHRCVNSILNQTFSDFELILVDDGSPDNCGEICEDYAKKDFRVKVIHQVNGGQAAARNNGVKEAQGEWLHFVDSDDMIHPKTLEILYKTAIDNDVKLSMCSAFQGENIPDDFSKNFDITANILNMDEENIFHLCKNEKYYYWVVWGKLIHKSIFLKHPLTEGRIYEDNAIVCKWLHEAKKVAVIPSPLYFYYINTSGTTKKNFTEKQLDILWAFEEQISYFHSLDYEKMTEHLVSYYFEISANMHYRAKHEGNNKKHIKIIKEHKKHIEKTYSKYIHLDTEKKLYIYEKTNPFMFFFMRIKRKLLK